MIPFRTVLIALTIGSATVAIAQVNPPTAGDDHGQGAGSEWRGRFEARRAERARALHEVLGIQPAQEAAFNAFIATMARPHGDAGQDGDPRERQDDPAATTTPQRLEAMRARMDAHITRVKKRFARRSAATLALYQVLDDRQRRIMNALPRLGDAHGGGWRGRG